MTRHELFLSLVLVPSLATGCIVTKDMGEEADSESETAADSESGAATMTSVSDDDAGATSSVSDDGPVTMTSASDDDATATGSVSDDDATATGSVSDDDATATGSDAGIGTTDDGGSDGSGTGSGDESDCESTGGTWVETSCGHYECGMPPVCAAVIPGCDCGPTMNFVEGTGCVEDPACQ
jgi:hypothetical protein